MTMSFLDWEKSFHNVNPQSYMPNEYARINFSQNQKTNTIDNFIENETFDQKSLDMEFTHAKLKEIVNLWKKNNPK